MPITGSGKFKKLFRKDKKSLNTQRVVISDTQKYGFEDENDTGERKVSNLEAVDFTNLYEEAFLEETPLKDAMIEKPAVRGKHRGKKTTEIISDKPAAVSKSVEKRAVSSKGIEKRYNSKRKRSFSIFSAISQFFSRGPKTSNSSALEFAGNKKRLGKKGRKSRRVFIYAGTGAAVVIITLVIVLVSGESATANNPASGSLQPSAPSYVVDNTGKLPSTSPTQTGGTSVSPTVSASVSPTPSRTAIPTTSPDVTLPSIDIDDEVNSFMVEANEYYNDMGYSNNHYKYTQEEKSLLSQVIWEEARGEGLKGAIAVGNVIMNRVLSSRFPGNNIKSVVTTGQFATPGGKTNSLSNSAANYVLDYEVWEIPQNIYFFKVPNPSDPKANWTVSSTSIIYTLTINHHAFYTAKKYGRTGKIPPRLFERTFKWPTIGCKPEMRVYKLQYMLNKLGYDVKADKFFGQDTKDAIIDFQKKHKIKADGIAGKKTLELLIKEFGYDKYYEAFYGNN